jgi:hypothetical protein
MRFLMPILLLALASAGCRDMRPKAQEWMLSAPEKTTVGVSCHLGWLLERPELREVIAKYPVFDQALELFLDKVQFDPSSETGRVSFYMLEFPNIKATDDYREMLLIQIDGFRDAKAVQRVIAETFPPEGSLRVGRRELPLFLVLDINNVQIRILSDMNGKLWIGDLAALNAMAKRRDIGENSPVSRASEWVSHAGAIQGFVQPELIPGDVLRDYANLVPTGIKGLAWSIAPPKNDDQIIELDLVVTGTEDAVAQLKPWMQRFIATISSLAGGGARQPETIQEYNRMGIRCQLKEDQLENVLNLFDMKGIITVPADVFFSAPVKHK